MTIRWVINETYWGHLFSVLLEAHSLLSSIIFLSSLTMDCLHNSKVELELNISSFLFHAFHASISISAVLEMLKLSACFHLFSRLGTPALWIWLEKIRNKPNRRNIISHLMGRREDHSLLGERRGWIRKGARIDPINQNSWHSQSGNSSDIQLRSSSHTSSFLLTYTPWKFSTAANQHLQMPPSALAGCS